MCFNCAMEPGVEAHTFNHSKGRGGWVSREANKNEGMQWKKFPSKTLKKGFVQTKKVELLLQNRREAMNDLFKVKDTWRVFKISNAETD